MLCVICKNPVDGYGHNPEPVCPGTCCSICNDTVVIPARLAGIVGRVAATESPGLESGEED